MTATTGTQALDSRLSTQLNQEQRALTIVERVEQSQAIALLDSRATALLELLPDAAAVSRFRRIVIQALAKNLELLECTPESVVLSVFEAATQGLEPTGAAGGAHLVPFRTKVSKNPDRWEKRAQLIPDYRGIVQLVTKPRIDPKTGRVIAPSEVLAVEARVVKEGDEFSWTEGSDARVHHIPSLAADRSQKATTHVYAIARFRDGSYSKPEVMDRTEVERIRHKGGRGEAFSPWATDWDEMSRKTVVKRLSKLLPVSPEIRSILVREDELIGDVESGGGAAPTAPAGPTKVSRLASRLGATPPTTEAPAAEPPTGDDAVEGSFVEVETPAATEAQAAAPATPTETVAPAPEIDLATMIRSAAAASELEGPASKADVTAALESVFKGWDHGLVSDGIRAIFGPEAIAHPSAAQVHALRLVGDSLPPVAFVAGWKAAVEQAAGSAAETMAPG